MKKKYAVMILEDDPDSVEQLTQILEQTDLFTTPFVCSTSTQAMNALYEHTFDILFLDIELPDIFALELLRMSPNHPPVCVVSNYPNYAIDCYELGIEDFIVKPISYPRVLRSVNRILRKTPLLQEAPKPTGAALSAPTLPNYIYLKTGRQIVRFIIDDIVYLESYHVYTKLFNANSFTVINEKISVLEERLSAHNFIRVHKSFLINLNKVTQFKANTIWLDNLRIPIGGVFKYKLQERLKTLGIE